ncbi:MULTISPECIES: 4-oxalocrotonate tautomerase family protein [Variovorax]|nr:MULTISPECIES: 4-oxalocrotonate tautomerase family protein [Variovorax]
MANYGLQFFISIGIPQPEHHVHQGRFGAGFNRFKEHFMPVVRVSWFEGKDHAQKEKVASEITQSIVRNTGTDPNYIYVIFEDVKASDWAGAGKLFGKASEESAG